MSTIWHVVRMEQQAGGDVSLTCLDGEYPLTVTLASDDGRNLVTTFCAPLEEADPCEILSLFSLPDGDGDWAAECA